MSATIGKRWKRWPRRAVLSVLLLPLLAGGTIGLRWAALNLSVFPFIPACRDYGFAVIDDLHFVWGETSREFRAQLRRYHSEQSKRFPESWGTRKDIRFSDGRVYVTPSFYFPFRANLSKYGEEVEERSHFQTREIAYRIYQRRLAEGRFEGVDMRPYHIDLGSKSRPDIQPMKPDQCGFMEELILEGGRFAGPAANADGDATAPAAQAQ